MGRPSKWAWDLAEQWMKRTGLIATWHTRYEGTELAENDADGPIGTDLAHHFDRVRTETLEEAAKECDQSMIAYRDGKPCPSLSHDVPTFMRRDGAMTALVNVARIIRSIAWPSGGAPHPQEQK